MTDVPAAPSIGVRDLLRIPDFRRLYLAQAISDLGDGMTYLALFLLVLNLTGSTAAIALMSILVALPPVTIGLFAGAYADRHDRRRIMLVSDALRAVVVVSMVLVARADALPALFALAAAAALGRPDSRLTPRTRSTETTNVAPSTRNTGHTWPAPAAMTPVRPAPTTPMIIRVAWLSELAASSPDSGTTRT